MPLPAAPTTKNDGDTLTAALWNANNSLWYTALANYVVFKDVGSQVVTKTLTLTPDAGAALTVTTGGITITAGGLTVTAGNVAVTAGNLTFGAASAKIIPGATSLLFRDNGDANTNLSITDAGAVTVRAGLTVTAGGLTVSAGTTAVGALTTGAITVTGAKITAAATAAGYASLNLPHGTAPSSPANGDVWTTTGGLYGQINGTTQGPYLYQIPWDTGYWYQATDDTVTSTAVNTATETTLAIPAGQGSGISESSDVLTITNAGYYLVSAVISYVSGTEGSPTSRYVKVENSGASEVYGYLDIGANSMSTAPRVLSFVRYFAGSDTVRFRLFHNGGSTTTYGIASATIQKLKQTV